MVMLRAVVYREIFFFSLFNHLTCLLQRERTKKQMQVQLLLLLNSVEITTLRPIKSFRIFATAV